ncbi:hypothetical protein [Streptomyces sp. NPDC052114]|uniref:hypothetical protein n=1 Tax=unclassified Streptomyces TaxID=2593676 RepID=UPI00342541A3
MTAAHTAEREEDRRARETYNVLLAHIDACRACQAMKTCDGGTRIRRALRAAARAAQTANGSMLTQFER